MNYERIENKVPCYRCKVRPVEMNSTLCLTCKQDSRAEFIRSQQKKKEQSLGYSLGLKPAAYGVLNACMIAFTAFILLISLHSHGRGSPQPSPKPVSPVPEKPITIIAKGVGFSPLRNHTAEEKEVVAVAEKLANSLLHSKCFADFMVNRKLIETNGKTPAEVVEHLKSLNLTVPVEMYSRWWSNVVGYRNPPKPDVFTNRKFHAGATACSRGSNLTHEWSHSAGYDHSFKSTPTRPFSVPYSINAAFTACCECSGKSIKNCWIR